MSEEQRKMIEEITFEQVKKPGLKANNKVIDVFDYLKIGRMN